MAFANINPGSDVPNEVNVIIEIPCRSHPVKYEVDKDSSTMFVDRFMATAMYYPCNYGYVPQTLSEDGDPSDVLVITPFPLITGSVIRSRPIGVLQMTDEKGPDAKILAVPADDLTLEYKDIHEPEHVSIRLRETIEHFFTHYKDLEPNKWVKVAGWADAATAKKEIVDAIARYKNS